MQKQFKLGILFEIDTTYWSVIPSLNINFHKGIVELEWLCFGIYLAQLDELI